MVIDVGSPSGFIERKEERPTKDISGFMEELVNLIKKKFEAQNIEMERLKTNINMFKENDLDNFSRKIIEIENRISSLEKKIREEKTNIDGKILDSLKSV